MKNGFQEELFFHIFLIKAIFHLPNNSLHKQHGSNQKNSCFLQEIRKLQLKIEPKNIFKKNLLIYFPIELF